MPLLTEALPSFVPPLPIEEIGHGKKAICYRVGEDHVVKAERALFDSADGALQHANSLQADYNSLVSSCLGKYVAPSMFVVEDRKPGYSVACVQQYVEGMSIKEAIKAARNDKEGTDIEPVIDFLSKTVAIYYEKEITPDLSATPPFLGWFKPTKTPNVIVQNEEGLLTPTLIDVGFITGGKVEMLTHPLVLRDSIAARLLTLTFEFSDRIGQQAIDNAYAVVALTPVGY